MVARARREVSWCFIGRSGFRRKHGQCGRQFKLPCGGIVPTIRLTALRDAVEDYDYPALLAGMGMAAEADTVVKPLAESFVHWERDPAAYEQARAALAALILRASMRRAGNQPSP